MRTPHPFAGLVLTAVLTLGACGIDDDEISASDREKASEAAIEYVGGGAATDVERGDGDDGYAYEVEITLTGGTDITVELNKDFKVINNPPTIADLGPSAGAPTTTAPTPRADPGERPLTGATLKKASAAALKATDPDGTVVEATASDDADHAYEVEIQLPNGQDQTVELDRSFTVVGIDD